MLRSALVAVSVAACGPAPTHTAIGNHGARLHELPRECVQRPYEGGPPWHKQPGFACSGVQRAPDGGWVTVMGDELAAYDRGGRLRWRADLAHGDAKVCGAVEGFAVDAVGRTVIGCGYSLLAFAADGAFRWQVWPGGNHGVGAPVVDSGGTIFVGVDGTLYAVSPADGATRWTVSTGFNRWFGSITATRRGTLLIRTSMAEEHEPFDGPGYHFYYDYEPPELIEIDRHGAIVSRTAHEPTRDWPDFIDLVGERGGRLPAP